RFARVPRDIHRYRQRLVLRPAGAARSVISSLPGGARVTLDHEIFDPAKPDRTRGDIEHTIVARAHDGGADRRTRGRSPQSRSFMMEPGRFDLGTEGSPFPCGPIWKCPSRADFDTPGGTDLPVERRDRT